MKRTSARLVVILVVIAAIVAYLLELTLISTGGLSIVPPVSLSVTLVAIAAGVIGLAIPVRRRVTGKRKAPLNPFYSVRVAVLAKSCTLTGALLTGAGVGIIIHLVGRPFLNWSLLGPGIAQAVGSAILLAAGLVAERMCTLPPPEDESEAEADSRPAGGSHA